MNGSSDYERFMSYVDVSAGITACHPWIGGRHDKGYGMFWAAGKMCKAHRWLLGFLRGEPLEADECALHRCDNPPCCNPRHLYVGDLTQNMRDMVQRHRHPIIEIQMARTVCPNGHRYDGANTYRRNGRRRCRRCHNERQRAERLMAVV